MARLIATLTILLTLAFSSVAIASKRVALVIGNAGYQHAPELANPHNDAKDIAAKLEGMGFDVVRGLDLSMSDTRNVVRDFILKLNQADVALFFYAGHGLQVNGQNYMAPVDAKLSSYDFLQFETLPINTVVEAMERNVKTNLVFLDACRDNPLAQNLARSMGTRSGNVGRGLAKLGSGIGTLIAFSTQPGNVALDGEGRNSPYTSALLKHLGTPGADITRDLVKVRNDVLAATNGKQVPWENSSLTGEVILVPQEKAPTPIAKPTTVKPFQSDRAVELAYWDSIKNAASVTYYEAYLTKYPDGLFVDIARIRISELKQKEEASRLAKEARKAETEKQQEEAKRLAYEKLQQELEKARRKAAEEAEKAAAERWQKKLAEARREAAEAANRKREQEVAEAKRKATEASERLAAAEADKKALAKASRKVEERGRDSNVDRTNSSVSATNTEEPAKSEQIAALTPSETKTQATATQPDPTDDRRLIRDIQSELNRVGCTVGSVDGVWGRGSKQGLKNYARHDKLELASLDPSRHLLERLEREQTRVCPLVCGSGYEKKNGRCVAIKRKQPTKAKRSVEKAKSKNNQQCGYCGKNAVRSVYLCGQKYLNAKRRFDITCE